MNNAEVVEANTLRMKARVAIRGLVGLPTKIKEAVLAAIDTARLPIYKYFKISKPDTAQAFIRKVLAGLGDVDEKTKREITRCLQQTIL